MKDAGKSSARGSGRHSAGRQSGRSRGFDESVVMRRDVHTLGRLQQADPAGFAMRFEASRMQLAQRRASPVRLEFPEALPITAHANEIGDLLKRHQVLVVAGETGSGKTTQLPKICLEAGFGRRGMIGHTQPRRLAARSVAARIAHTGFGYSNRIVEEAARDILSLLDLEGGTCVFLCSGSEAVEYRVADLGANGAFLRIAVCTGNRLRPGIAITKARLVILGEHTKDRRTKADCRQTHRISRSELLCGITINKIFIGYMHEPPHSCVYGGNHRRNAAPQRV